jgi:hypothetical protein
MIWEYRADDMGMCADDMGMCADDMGMCADDMGNAVPMIWEILFAPRFFIDKCVANFFHDLHPPFSFISLKECMLNLQKIVIDKNIKNSLKNFFHDLYPPFSFISLKECMLFLQNFF